MNHGGELVHAASVRVAVAAERALAFLADPAELAGWATGLTEQRVIAPLLVCGRLVDDAAPTWCRIEPAPAQRIVTYWHDNLPADYEPMAAPWESLIAKYALLDETDSLLEAAIELAQKNDTISASFLQRKLRLGYPRAARIMEHLFEMGLVEDPKAGGKTRRTLVDEDDDPLDDILQS